MSTLTLHLSTIKVSNVFLNSLPQNDLVLELCPELGGAWTELRCNHEVILFGYPKNSPNPWFQTLVPPKTGHNILSQALERIVFARGINEIRITEQKLQPIASHMTSLHPDAVTLITSGLK